MKPLPLLLIVAVLSVGVQAAKVKRKAVSHANPPSSVLILEPQEGTYNHDGAGTSRLKIRNRFDWPVTIFFMRPGETVWTQEGLTREDGSSGFIPGLPDGIYQVAAERNRVGAPGFETPSFWDFGPVTLHVRKSAKWTLK